MVDSGADADVSDGPTLDAADASTDAPSMTPGFTTSAPSGSLVERGAPVTFTVSLSVAPTADVTIALSSGDLTEATVSPATMTFTNADWQVPKTVTVTSVDDWTSDGSMNVPVLRTAPTSADARYASLPSSTLVTVSNADDDVGGGYRLRTTHAEDGAPFYVAHSYYHAMITTLTDTANSQRPGDFEWRIVPGLADPSDPTLVSFISPGFPGRYLRIDSENLGRYPSGAEGANREYGLGWTPVQDRNHLPWLDPYVDSATFRNDATFRVVPARDGDPAKVSLAWYVDESRFLRHQNYQVYARVPDGSALQNTEVSFTLEPLGFLVDRRADPHITRHSDGYYYMTASVPEYDRIEIRRATTLRGLATAEPSVIWTKHATGVMGAHIWAPELHHINGKWYVHFAAGEAENVWAIRMYVLESSAANPMTGPFTERGQVNSPWSTFSLDATTFELGGTRYLLWAQDDPSINDDGTSIFIAAMSDPWTITGTPVRITRPELAWETMGFAVNEGPAVLVRNGRVFVSYSASATDARYCLGLLTASDSSNLLDAASWTKSPTPVFSSANGLYGPGHNSFTTARDGTVDVLVYHARNYQQIVGDSLYDGNRHTRLQRLDWNVDGTPSFGAPLLSGFDTIGE